MSFWTHRITLAVLVTTLVICAGCTHMATFELTDLRSGQEVTNLVNGGTTQGETLIGIGFQEHYSIRNGLSVDVTLTPDRRQLSTGTYLWTTQNGASGYRGDVRASEMTFQKDGATGTFGGRFQLLDENGTPIFELRLEPTRLKSWLENVGPTPN